MRHAGRIAQSNDARGWVGVAALASLALATWMQKLPLLVLLIYAGMSILALAVYAIDKAAAQRGTWRKPQSMLHFLALAGGWPGALIAQDVLRHKLRTLSFQVVFWITVAMNLAALAWWISQRG